MSQDHDWYRARPRPEAWPGHLAAGTDRCWLGRQL